MKKEYFLKLLFITSLSFGHISSSWANEISLDQAVAYAIEHSPVLQGTASGVRASNEQIKTAEAAKLPVI